MYSPIDYSNKIIKKEDLDKYSDNNLLILSEIYPNSIIVEQTQNILSSNAKNLSVHTWYLSKNNLFENDESKILVSTDSEYKYKNEVVAYIFDPNNLFDKSIYISNKKNQKYITIIKQSQLIKPSFISNLYLHTHNIDGIFRFSPKNNSKIKFNSHINSGIYYVIVEGLILLSKITIILD